MSFWSAEHLRGVMGASWVARPGSAVEITGLSTDTRTLTAGQVFLALKGDRFDGHAMVGSAAGAGASLAIIDDERAMGAAPAGLGVMRVADTKRALLQLASAYREKLTRTTVIAVCGSNGKTTTVRLIDAVLGAGGGLSGSASPKSFNNHIGVPLTVLGARAEHAYLICEVGTNARGEIAQLSRVVRPDVAVITSIGREHLEKLGSVREVAREEASVLEFVRRGGAGVVHAEGPHLLETIATLPERPSAVIRFGEGSQADVRVVEARADGPGVQVLTLNDKTQYRVPLAGRHNALNAAAAIAVGRRLGLSPEQIRAGLLAVKPAPMRLELMEIGGVRVVNDAYNANPDSMRAALATLGELSGGSLRRVVVLGDMLELGAASEGEHRDLGTFLAGVAEVERVVLVGRWMSAAAEGYRAAGGAATVEHLAELDAGGVARIAGMCRAGDVVLVKGSRGMRLERVVEAMRTGAAGGKG